MILLIYFSCIYVDFPIIIANFGYLCISSHFFILNLIN